MKARFVQVEPPKYSIARTSAAISVFVLESENLIFSNIAVENNPTATLESAGSDASMVEATTSLMLLKSEALLETSIKNSRSTALAFLQTVPTMKCSQSCVGLVEGANTGD